MMISPATVLVLLIAGVLLVLGAVLLGRSTFRGAGPACRQCLHPNPPGAKYCGQCGRPL